MKYTKQMRKGGVLSTFTIARSFSCWSLQQDLSFESPNACNHYLHQPHASPLISLHEEVQHVPLATLSKKWHGS